MRILILLIVLISSLSSCSTLDKSRMLKTPTNYKFKEFLDSVDYKKSYTIAVDDEISVQMYSNDGYNIVNIGGNGQNNGRAGMMTATTNQQNRNIQNGGSYKVRSDSTIKVPVIGKIKVVGLTLTQIEQKFEALLESQVNSPFVIARIFNRRVYIFQGGYSASVFQLLN